MTRDLRSRIKYWSSLCLVVGIVLSTASATPAAFTTEKCLAGKAKAWGRLRQCQRTEDAKRLQAKRFDLAKCQAKLDDQLVRSTAKAAKSGVACRFGDNGDGTVVDYDTGLQWEQKRGVFGGLCLVADTHCVNDTYNWNEAREFVAGASDDGSTLTNCFAGHCDWRLPRITELQTILLEANPCGTSPCIDPTFGATAQGGYWSSTTFQAVPANAWAVFFQNGGVSVNGKTGSALYLRAVRGGL